MREEHPLQTELDGLPPGGPVPGPSAQVVEMSEVAAVQVKALELGLVREARPVFVYDQKLAKAKSGNAERQARHREKQASMGLVPVRVPQAIADQVKELGGDWSKLTQKAATIEVIKEVIKEVTGPTVFVEKIVEKIVEKPVVRLTAEQKKALKIGQKVVVLTGWRGNLVRYLLGIQPEKEQKMDV